MLDTLVGFGAKMRHTMKVETSQMRVSGSAPKDHVK